MNHTYLLSLLKKLVFHQFQMQKVVWKANTVKAEEASKEMEAFAYQVKEGGTRFCYREEVFIISPNNENVTSNNCTRY